MWFVTTVYTVWVKVITKNLLKRVNNKKDVVKRRIKEEIEGQRIIITKNRGDEISCVAFKKNCIVDNSL